MKNLLCNVHYLILAKVLMQLFISKLQCVIEALHQKCSALLNRMRFIHQPDNTRPHPAKQTQENTKLLVW